MIKLKKQADSYLVPYLNTDGEIVRWRIESYDDCFATDIEKAANLDNPEGIEVFSTLGKRENKGKNALGWHNLSRAVASLGVAHIC